MIYLTNDALDQGVYFELCSSVPSRRGGVSEQLIRGLLGNGVMEVPVSVRSRRDYQEVVFGREDLFGFVDERMIRRLLGEMAREMVLQ